MSPTKQASERGSYDPIATRARLVEAALELFGTQGFHATSVKAIADEAGLTKGALYHHFASKDELLREIHDEYVDHQLREFDRIVAEYDDPRTQLEQLIHSILASVDRFRRNVTVFFQERRYLTGEHFEAVKAKRDRLDRGFRDVIDRGMAEGVFREDLDARAVTLGIIGMCAWTYQWLQPGGPLSAADVADNYARMVLDGLLP